MSSNTNQEQKNTNDMKPQTSTLLNNMKPLTSLFSSANQGAPPSLFGQTKANAGESNFSQKSSVFGTSLFANPIIPGNNNQQKNNNSGITSNQNQQSNLFEPQKSNQLGLFDKKNENYGQSLFKTIGELTGISNYKIKDDKLQPSHGGLQINAGKIGGFGIGPLFDKLKNVNPVENKQNQQNLEQKKEISKPSIFTNNSNSLFGNQHIKDQPSLFENKQIMKPTTDQNTLKSSLFSEPKLNSLFGETKLNQIAVQSKSNGLFGDQKPGSLFGDASSGSLFGGDGKTNSLFGAGKSSLFSYSKPNVIENKEENKPSFGLFGQQDSSKSINLQGSTPAKETHLSEKIGEPSKPIPNTPFFGGINAPKDTKSKDTEEKPKQSGLFNNLGTSLFAKKENPAPFFASTDKTQKPESNSKPTNLFTPNPISNPIIPTFNMPESTQKQKPINTGIQFKKANQIKQTTKGFQVLNNPSNNSQKKPSSLFNNTPSVVSSNDILINKPIPPVINKEQKEIKRAGESIMNNSQLNQSDFKKPQQSAPKQGLLFSFTEQNDKKKYSFPQTQTTAQQTASKAPTDSISAPSSKINQKSQNDITLLNIQANKAQNIGEKEKRLFSRPEQGENSVISLRRLKEQSKNDFSNFFQKQKRNIFQSIQEHFTIRTGFALAIPPCNEAQINTNRFILDFSKLIMKIFGMEDKSLRIIQYNFRRMLEEEKYSEKLFEKDQINFTYFKGALIYYFDSEKRSGMINEKGSNELNKLIYKFMSYFGTIQLGYLTLLKENQDLIRLPSRLFEYFFNYLLMQETKKFQTENTDLIKQLVELQNVIKKKIYQIIMKYNNKLGSSYTFLSEKNIPDIIDSIDQLKDQKIIDLSLRVLINNIDFKGVHQQNAHLLKKLRGSKSLALLPLRVLVPKLSKGSIHSQYDIIPSLPDLYKYVNGDSWAEWVQLYLEYQKQLQPDEPKYLTNVLKSFSPSELVNRILKSKKGISKLVASFKDKNYMDYFYQILEVCTHSQESLKALEQFYLKRASFYNQFKEIFEFVIRMPQNINQQIANIDCFESKLLLLIKIIEIDPDKLLQLEKKMFFQQNNKNQGLEQSTCNNRDGQKMIHFFIDILNITVLTSGNPHVICKIFDMFVSVLRKKQLQLHMIECFNVNRPSFAFIENNFTVQVASSMNEMLKVVFTELNFYDLVHTSSNESIRWEIYYPFRYLDHEYIRLAQNQINKKDNITFPFYWINNLFKAIEYQSFNPQLLNILLEKFYITPYTVSTLKNIELKCDKFYSKNQMFLVPHIYENIIKLINSYPLWQNIAKRLQFHVRINQIGQVELTNDVTSVQNYKEVYYSLQLLRTIFSLAQLLKNYQDVYPDHFIIRSLSAINLFGKTQMMGLLQPKYSHQMASGLFMSVILNIRPNQDTINPTFHPIQWEGCGDKLEQIQEILIKYAKNHKNEIDYELIEDCLKRPRNRYLEAQQNVSSVCLDILGKVLTINHECSIQLMIANYFQLHQGCDKIITKIKEMFVECILEYAIEGNEWLRAKIFDFLYKIRYGCRGNKTNKNLADRIIKAYIDKKHALEVGRRAEYNLLKYFRRQIWQNNFENESYIENLAFCSIKGFVIKDSCLEKDNTLQDIKQLKPILERYRKTQYELYNLNQLERIIEQQNIVKIGEELLNLHNIISIVAKQIVRKRVSTNLINCLHAVNRLLAKHNFALLDLGFNCSRQFEDLSNEQLEIKSEQPRLFVRDSLEYYLSEIRDTKQKISVQELQKANVLEWIKAIISKLSRKINNFTKLCLSIDKYFYSNNPLDFPNLTKFLNLELFCHTNIDPLLLSAVEIYGNNNQEAANIIQMTAENIYTRLCAFSLEEYSNTNYKDIQNSFKEGFQMVGLCLEWLRARKDDGDKGCRSIIRLINRNIVLCTPNSQLLIPQSVKLLLSCLDIHPQFFTQKSFAFIKSLIVTTLKKPTYAENLIKTQEELQLTQMILILLSKIPIDKKQNYFLALILKHWQNQVNFQYFYNQTRILIELCKEHGESIARMKPFQKCQMLVNATHNNIRYQERQRKSQSMSWIWILQFAVSLSSQNSSLAVNDEVTNFIIKNKEKILEVLNENETKITKAYLEQLSVVLQLLLSLFSQPSWAELNEKLAEQITYLLSNRLIRLFVNLSQSRLSHNPVSNNDHNLSKAKALTSNIQDFSNYGYEDSFFNVQMRILLLRCLSYYSLLMQAAFNCSKYIQKYFIQAVYDKLTYNHGFWENFNRQLTSILVFVSKQIDYWRNFKKLNDNLFLTHKCASAPYSFVENGYLPALSLLPANQNELFEELYLLNYVLGELGLVHLVNQRKYMAKNRTLVSANIEVFGRKIKDHFSNLQIEKKRTNLLQSALIGDKSISGLVDSVDFKGFK